MAHASDEKRRREAPQTSPDPPLAFAINLNATESDRQDAPPSPRWLVPHAPSGATSSRRRRTAINRSYRGSLLTADEKRERSRATFKRFYERRKHTLIALRAEEETLRLQFESLLSTPVQDTETTTPFTRYRHIVRLKEHLLRANTALQDAVDQHITAQAAIQRICAAEADEMLSDPSRVDPTHSPFEYLRKYSADDADRNASSAIEQLSALSFHDDAGCRSFDAFGWRCRYRHSRHCVEYELRTAFRFVTARQTRDHLWTYWTRDRSQPMETPTNGAFAAIPSSLLREKRRKVCAINETHCVLHRTLCSVRRERDAVFHSELLMSRRLDMTTEPTASTVIHLIVTSSLRDELRAALESDVIFDRVDEEQVKVDDAPASEQCSSDALGEAPPSWTSTRESETDDPKMKELSWWKVQAQRSDGETKSNLDADDEPLVLVTVAGRMPVTLHLSARMWLLELLLTAMAWQAAFITTFPHTRQASTSD
ncbi:hypothetical protein P43SY_001284 [Pythium insidiosum]|uniref:Uncharacterized protein n=1 Tax=Pythium insidiosum TaxID=114742 RepID=A0AAD5M4E0_PYTIN|nr:hypothetical protein P43SY_001284 [Pythium insidiosum]